MDFHKMQRRDKSLSVFSPFVSNKLVNDFETSHSLLFLRHNKLAFFSQELLTATTRVA